MPRYAVTLHLLERYVGKEVIVVVTKPEGRKHKVEVVDTTKYFSLFLIIGIETENCFQKNPLHKTHDEECRNLAESVLPLRSDN